MSDRNLVPVLGVDPGKTCGWTMSHGGEHCSSFGADDWDYFLEWIAMVLSTGAVDRVAMERFHTRSLTDDSELTIEVIGAIKYICRSKGIVFGMVNPSDKKKTMKYVPDRITNRHARDAEAVRLWDLRYGKW